MRTEVKLGESFTPGLYQCHNYPIRRFPDGAGRCGLPTKLVRPAVRLIRRLGVLAYVCCLLSGVASFAIAVVMIGLTAAPATTSRLITVGAVMFVAGCLASTLSIISGDVAWIRGRRHIIGMTIVALMWAGSSVMAAVLSGSPSSWRTIWLALLALTPAVFTSLAQGMLALRAFMRPYNNDDAPFYALSRRGVPKTARRLNECDAQLLRVLRSVRDGAAGTLPAYLERDNDADLHKVLKSGHTFIRVSGPAISGKSRSAFEAVRAARPRDHVLVPCTKEALDRVLGNIENLPRKSVLWLDADQFGSALNPRLLSACSQRGVTILMTQRDHGAPPMTHGGLGIDAMEIRYEEHLTSQERTRALELAHDDRRWADALRHLDVGFARYLSRADVVLDAWKARGKRHPRSGSTLLIQAAIDCRRAGFFEPISEDLLCALLSVYTGIPPVGVPQGDIAEALASVVPLDGDLSSDGLGLLTQMPGGYDVLSLLVGHSLPEYSVVPRPVWDILIEHAAPHGAGAVADAALAAGVVDVACAAYRKASAADSLIGIHLVARDAVAAGDLDTAIRWYERAATLGDPLGLYRQVELLHAKERYAEARKGLRDKAVLQPGDLKQALRHLTTPHIARNVGLRPFRIKELWFLLLVTPLWLISPLDFDIVPVVGWIDDGLLILRLTSLLFAYVPAKRLARRLMTPFVLWEQAGRRLPAELRAVLLDPLPLPPTGRPRRRWFRRRRAEAIDGSTPRSASLCPNRSDV